MARDVAPSSLLPPTDWSERDLHIVTKLMLTMSIGRSRIASSLPDAQRGGGHSPWTPVLVPFSTLIFIAATLVVSQSLSVLMKSLVLLRPISCHCPHPGTSEVVYT